jgi:hypothetical protein
VTTFNLLRVTGTVAERLEDALRRVFLVSEVHCACLIGLTLGAECYIIISHRPDSFARMLLQNVASECLIIMDCQAFQPHNT